MSSKSAKNHSKSKFDRGFALVATLMLMILLGLLAIGMLSLSGISLRSSSQNSAMSEARANARMALMLAIGELQKHTGLDTRITAPADIVEDGAPPLTGVWKSWEGTNHDPITGRPVKPEYENDKWKSTEIGDRFIAWLVSGADSPADLTNPNSLVWTNIPDEAEPPAGFTPLLGEGTLGDDNPEQVYVRPQMVDNNRGALAWWVSPENQKARLIQPYKPRTSDVAGWSDMGKTHSAPDPEPFGLDSLVSDPEDHTPDPTNPKSASKAVSLATTRLLVNANLANPQQSFHDLSTSSVGLLTNTATGGWRKDMSLLTEKWDDIYTKYNGGTAMLPLFRYLPEAGKTTQVPKPTEANYEPRQSNFYPWSGYSLFGAPTTQKTPLTYNTATASWQSLVNFATKYKSLTFNAGTSTVSSPIGWNHFVAAPTSLNANYTIPQKDYYTQYHELPLNPVLARVQLVIQANAIQDLNPYDYLADPSQFHRINLRVIPFFTLWNPYNVEIRKDHPTSTSPEYGITTMRSMPTSLSISNLTAPPSNGVAGNFKLINGGWSDSIDGNTGNFDTQLPGANGSYYGVRNMHAYLPRVFSLKPGEVKIFAPQENSPSNPEGTVNYFSLLMKEGYDVGVGFGTLLANPDNLPLTRSKTQSQYAGSGNKNFDHTSTLAKKFFVVPADNAARRVTVQTGFSTNPTPNPALPTYGQTYMLYSTDRVKFAIKGDRLTKIFTNAVTTNVGTGADFMVGRSVSQYAPNGGRSALENGKTNVGVNRFHSVHAMSADLEWARKYWPTDELAEVDYQVSDLVPGGGNRPWTNIFSVSFGPRLSFGAAPGDVQNRPTKGLLQSSPFANSAFSLPNKTANNHPANGAYDISYNTFPDGDDSYMPEIGNSGYIATGFKVGDGLSRLIMAEVPIRPIASLAELQSWNLRGNNPLPPHQFNIIGNSDATPLITKDSILPATPTTTNVATNLQHDDAYCANHLLFDDWFFSSIAPEPTTFGQTISKDIDAVYREYLTGSRELTNRAYRPIAEDRALTTAVANQRIAEIVNSPDGDGWLKVASRFEVDGMFNVNSTSVKAWRALLGHARQLQVAHHSAAGMVVPDPPVTYDHVVSRHSVASDVEAGEDLGIGAAFPSGSEYAGFRTLSDEQLDELAAKVVDQVVLRGPFLSLSEFVNRQLSSDDDKALSGALQAALDSLTDDPMKALRDPANQLSDKAMDPDPANNPKMDGVGYGYEEAAAGISTHGFPGWIRQADILRPIAPVLSARDDTFTIRAYGDARDADGNITARAWCEATVQRGRDFVDTQDAADSIDPPLNIQNQIFGRRYKLTSFRWLSANEV